MRDGRIIQIGTPPGALGPAELPLCGGFRRNVELLRGSDLEQRCRAGFGLKSDARSDLLRGRANAGSARLWQGLSQRAPGSRSRMDAPPNREDGSLPSHHPETGSFWGEHTEYLVRHAGTREHHPSLAPRRAEQDASSFAVGAAAHVTWGRVCRPHYMKRRTNT